MNHGFSDVSNIAYSSNYDIRLETDQRLAELIETLYVNFLLRSKQFSDKNEACKRAEDLIEQHWELFAKGDSHPLTLMRVIGRKGSCAFFTRGMNSNQKHGFIPAML